MAETLPIRKLFVDSRFKTSKSASHSDFEYEIPQSVSLPDNTICFLDNIVIPNSWKTIDENNNRLYVRKYDASSNTTTDRILMLEPNNYNAQTLLTQLKDVINTVFPNFIASTSTYNQVLLRFELNTAANTQLKIFTDAELASGTGGWTGPAYDATDLKSINEVLTIFEPQQANPFKTGIINLARYRNLYISCPTLSDYSTISPSGNYNIVKKVPVTAGYGEIIYCNLQATHDHFDVSRMMLKSLEFKILDSYGRVVDLRGVPVTFSMIFMIRNID